jgi:FkbH-like protein
MFMENFRYGRLNGNSGYRCANKLRKHRSSIVKALIAGTKEPRINLLGESEQVFEARVTDSLDMLIRHVEGKRGFGALYAGERMFELFRPERSRDENMDLTRRSVEEDRLILHNFLEPLASAEELSAFEHAYKSATSGLGSQGTRHARTLIIGDCLTVEIASFLLAPLMAEGISFDPYPINSRDPVQLRQILDNLAQQEYDGIFFSPFSHARLPEVKELLKPANSFMPRAQLTAMVDSILEQTRPLLDYLSNRFDSPIFVHNAALIPRSRSILKVATLSMLTSRIATYARRRINQWLSDYVALHNSSAFQHMFVLDENEIAEQNRFFFGRYLHTSPFQHATNLSQKLADEYLLRIRVIADLLHKKLVIYDLDNTLWHVPIGEGAVTHFKDRQAILKKLKDHGGIVLSIASKSNRTDVHFTGGLLSRNDFVAPQIGENQKSDAIKAIERTLNLQTKHMIFLNESADERALVNEALPDILTLDAADPSVWKRLDLWADLIHGSSDLDRTRLYQEQALRDASIEVTSAPDFPPDGDALKMLGLVITVRSAEKRDLKRVTELINRTNQWNLCGARTSLEQIRNWHASDHAQVLIASAADRFGDMGVVCVSVVTMHAGRAEIPIFVLSCRVFGYGVETAVLNEIIRRCAVGKQKTTLVGHYRSTNQNHSCRNMYVDHGFEQVGGNFVWTGSTSVKAVRWAEIRVV